MYRLGFSILALQSLLHLGAQGLPQGGSNDGFGKREFIVPGNYRIDDCGADYQRVEDAITSAKTVAAAAVDVLKDSTKSSNEYVKKMLMDLVGVDDVSNADIQKARHDLETLAGIQPPGPFGFLETNTDVLFKCTGDHYENAINLKGESYTRHKPTGLGLDSNQKRNKEACFSIQGTTLESLQGQDLPLAQTINSDILTKDGTTLEQKNKAAVIDLCPWYLNFSKGFGTDYTLINRGLLEKVASPDFKLNPLEGMNTKVDVLSQSLAGTILHELAHTRLGGLAQDVVIGACYGWGCVKNLKTVKNADTINMIGVALWVWSEGFYIDTDGNVHARPT